MNKMIICLTFIASIMLTLEGLTQEASVAQKLIPKQYQKQFNIDSKRYLEYTNPAVTASGEAFNIWRAAEKRRYTNRHKDSLYSVYDSLNHLAWQRKVAFIKQNISSYASLYYFNQWFIRSSKFHPDSLQSLFLLMDKKIRATPLGKSVIASLKRKQLLQLNHKMPDFSFWTTQEKIERVVSLSDFRGKKNVLICFWASWCGPCVRNIPFLKQINLDYKEKGLEIVSISIDKDSIKWLTALTKYNMPWLQTCDLPAYTNNNSMCTLYEIYFIPQYFLINKEGKLVYQSILNEDNDDYTLLKETLNKVFAGL